MIGWCTNLFPAWVLLGGLLALGHPAWFVWFHGDLIVWGLAVIMLGMGITLSVDDFSHLSLGHRQPAGRLLALAPARPALRRRPGVTPRGNRLAGAQRRFIDLPERDGLPLRRFAAGFKLGSRLDDLAVQPP